MSHKLIFVILTLLKTQVSAFDREKPDIFSKSVNYSEELRAKVFNWDVSDERRSRFPYRLECTANYPIQWNFTGHAASKAFDVLEVQSFTSMHRFIRLPPQQLDWKYNTTVALEAGQNQYSSQVTCFSLEEPSVFDEVFVFRWNGTGPSLITPKINIAVNSHIITCPTLDPMTQVFLYITTKTGEQRDVQHLDDTLTYHPTKGFVSQHIFDGIYTCTQSSSRVTITAVSTASLEFQYSPILSFVPKWDNEIIHLECSSISGHALEIHVGNVYMREHRIFPKKLLSPMSTLNVSIYKEGSTTKADLQVSLSTISEITGEVRCVLNLSVINDTRIIKKWSFLFVETPKLRLEHEYREIECAASSTVTMQIFQCSEAQRCALCKDQFPRDFVDCNFKKMDTFGTFNELSSIEYISKTSYSPFIGLVMCLIVDSYFNLYWKTWDILETLDQRKRLSWMHALPNELVRIDEVPYILYTNDTTIFTCETLEYLFPRVPKFLVEFQNKSLTEVKYARFNNKVSDGRYSHAKDRLIAYLNIITVLRIKLPIDAVAVHCTAQWWNSSETFSNSRRFITRHLMSPKFSHDNQLNVSRVVFNVGDSGPRLNCTAEGEPMPSLQWFTNGTDALAVFPELQLISCENGKCFLEFPKISPNDREKFAGEYMCTATNKVGSINRTILLDIEEKPEDTNLNSIYVSTIVICGIILIVLVTILVVVTRRYRRNKSQLRDLTQNEVDDFFEGKPEMVANGTSIETVDYLPFNRDYEIPRSDLDFSLSEDSFLGSGEFAFVTRGKLLSSDKPVALKISKPSADVTLFKSLLSEIKIMIYIGQHENILSIIGVCTEEIMTRSVYIVTDICELGSLKSFLQKCKPHFFSLIDANQEIDVSLAPQYSNMSEYVTILDLIDFAAQIAKGMEYLAFKCVIHADLATRNVLLTIKKVAKVSDFGLSKRLYESTDYVKKSRSPLPWRWMALESLETLTFSTKSDVWAYGVTLYEIFTLGNAPFPNEQWSHEFVRRLKDGMRMGRPEFSTQEIYSKIVACWENAPELRPEFSILRAFFERLYEKHRICLPEINGSAQTHHYVNSTVDAENSKDPLTSEHEYLNCISGQSEIEMATYANLNK